MDLLTRALMKLLGWAKAAPHLWIEFGPGRQGGH
jgi:hypothetical protein